MVVTAGVDMGKDSLDVSISEGPVIRFDNTVKGIGKLLKHLKEQNATLVVCEATGGYERLLVTRRGRPRLRYTWPTRTARAFAKACGYEAKTDPRDAQALSRYGQVFPDKRTPQRELEPEREALRDLLRRRRQAAYSWFSITTGNSLSDPGIVVSQSRYTRKVPWIRSVE